MSDADDASFFKRIGVPASIAALLSTSLTIALGLFAIDARYAKSEDIGKVSHSVEALAQEVNRITGITQVLVQIAGRVEHSGAAPLAVNAPPDNPTLPSEARWYAVPEPTLKLGEILEAPPAKMRADIQAASGDELQNLLRESTRSLETSRQNLQRLKDSEL